MSQIRCIYEEEPAFPATDQHPDAVRYQVGKYVVDAIGGEPMIEEVEAVLNPPVVQKTVAEKFAALAASAGLTTAELKAELAK